MLESTDTALRLTLRYPNEQDEKKTDSFSFRHLDLAAGDDALLDLADAFQMLLYAPTMPVDAFKTLLTDLSTPA